MQNEELTKEISLLRSFAVSIVGRDREGAYRPDFVRKVLKANDIKPNRSFTNPDSFLAELASQK